MLIYAADDERLLLDELTDCIHAVCPGAEVAGFSNAGALLDAFEGGKEPYAAFLDIEMPALNGIDLAKRIKSRSPKTHIVFVTGFSSYALEAMRVHASGYLLKPVTPEAVRAEFDNFFTPLRAEEGKLLRVQCFGSFEVFSNGVPLSFHRSKSKEAFAVLVDRRGEPVSPEELMRVLWEGRPSGPAQQRQLQTVLSELTRTLRLAGAEELIRRGRNRIYIDPERIDCDYYRYLAGEPAALNAYIGEYMSNYGWAELAAGGLADFGNPVTKS